MNHQGTKTMETARLLLRRFTVGDARSFFQNVTSDPEVNRYLTWPLHENVEDTQKILSEWTERYANPERYCWAIVLKEVEEVIGTIAAPTVKNRTGAVEVTYCIGSRWWGQGIVPEALQVVMQYLFEEVQVNRIEAGFDANNPNSGRVMEKVGMQKEGILRQAGKNNQGLFDLVFYSILKDDWITLQRG
ncbi:MAG: GNAT family N-acetyltransferase [Lachnospiraceae bacterium]|nr:GNAT family N-acetyltransferase [Lachnospiraceae bacterium]